MTHTTTDELRRRYAALAQEKFLCSTEDVAVALAQEHGVPLRPQGPGLIFHAVMLKPGATEGPIRDYRDYVRRHDAARWMHLRRCLLEEGVRAIERGLWSISLTHTAPDIEEALKRAAVAFRRHAATWQAPA